MASLRRVMVITLVATLALMTLGASKRKKTIIDQCQRRYDSFCTMEDGRESQSFTAGEDGELLGLRLLVHGLSDDCCNDTDEDDEDDDEKDFFSPSDLEWDEFDPEQCIFTIKIVKIDENGFPTKKMATADVKDLKIPENQSEWVEILFDRSLMQNKDDRFVILFTQNVGYTEFAMSMFDNRYEYGSICTKDCDVDDHPKDQPCLYRPLDEERDLAFETIVYPKWGRP